jgi:hypothetical protein
MVYNQALRKVLAIMLLVVHLFNSGGYRLVFKQMEDAVGQRMISRIDELAYDDKDLVEIKVPVNLPYQSNWPEFERYDGEVYMDGVHYNYVKRKLHNDTLILLCLPNAEKMNLFNARETFFSLVNDLQQDQPAGQHPAPVKSVKFAQAECIVEEFAAFSPMVYCTTNSFAEYLSPSLGDCHSRSPERPPDALLG